MTMHLIDAATLSDARWPDSEDGDYARRALTPLVRDGASRYVANAHADLAILRAGPLTFPITLNRFDPSNSYVCSPYTHYVLYAQEELRELRRPRVEALLRALLLRIGHLLKPARFDHVVYVNNWLLSTNLYPAGSADGVAKIIPFLAARFPDRALIFRSIDAVGNPLLMEALVAAGCRLVFSRQIYYQQPQSEAVRRKKQYKIDLALARRSPYTPVPLDELPDSALVRVKQLYDALYLDKYSRFNPQFTLDFLRLARDERLLEIQMLREDGRLDGVIGTVTRNRVVTAPLFGYDTALPSQRGLYRLLTVVGSEQAAARGHTVHLSAGVGPFKRIRGGQATLEYNALYDRHLPAARRRPWTMLKWLLDTIAVPIVQRGGY